MPKLDYQNIAAFIMSPSNLPAKPGKKLAQAEGILFMFREALYQLSIEAYMNHKLWILWLLELEGQIQWIARSSWTLVHHKVSWVAWPQNQYLLHENVEDRLGAQLLHELQGSQ